MSDEEINQEFVQLGAKKGLTKRTMQCLFEYGFHDRKSLSIIAERQLRDMEIPTAQKLRLRKLVDDILLEEQLEEVEAPPQAIFDENGELVFLNEMDNAEGEEAKSGHRSPTFDPLIPTDNLLSKMMRPHESVFGLKTKDANFLQFLYANLLSLENIYRTDKKQSVGYLHHLHLLTLKLMQQYPVEDVFKFDFAVRGKVDDGEISWFDRYNIDSNDTLLKEHFNEEHLQKWKKMKKMNSRKQVVAVNAFKADRCLRWNYSKDGSDCVDDECKFIHVCLLCCGKHTLMKCPTSLTEKKEKKEEKKKPTLTTKGSVISPRT